MLRSSDVAMSLPKPSLDLLREIYSAGYVVVHRLPGSGGFELLQHGLAQSVTNRRGSTSLTLTPIGFALARSMEEKGRLVG